MLVRCNKNATRSISSFLANKSPGIIRNKFGLDLQLNQRSFHLSTSLAHNPRESRSSHNDHDHDHDHNHEKEMVDVHIHVPHYNKNFKFEAAVGDTLMDLVLKEGEELSEYFECACGGIAACSTCHVYLDKESYDKLGVPEDFELDMIDLAHTPKDTSRLGCQIQFSKNINGIKLTVPKGVNNLH
jgi:ferredoxin